jgi:NADH-quinone oxidoreductase subunit N
MPTNALLKLDVKDLLYLIPHIVLTSWGLLVLLVDQGLARRMSPTARRNAVGGLSMAGAALGLVAAMFVCGLLVYPDKLAWLPRSDLRLMSWGDGSGVPTSGNDLVIVGIDNNGLLHIRIFDVGGNRVTDTDETKLPGVQAGAISTLKQQLPGALPPHVLTSAQEAQVLSDVRSIVGQTLFFGTLAGNVQVAYFNVLYTGLLLLVFWLSTAWSFTEEWGEYFALMFWATVGMMLLTASEELVTLFITLETMTICLYLSTAMEKSRRRSAEGGLKYFVYGSVSSALFLFGLSMLYGLTGTTYFEGIRQVLRSIPVGPFVDRANVADTGLAGNVAGATAVLLMLVGFGFKVAAFPFHQWAPDAYEGAPAPVTAWIATGSKLASFVAMMKVFLHALVPWSNPSSNIVGPGWLGIIAVVAALTMTYGNFAALAQRNLKRMLAYSSIAHAGYILVGVATASVAADNSKAAGAVLYYLLVYAFANVGAFAVAAWLVRDKKTDDIDDLNGLGFQDPLLAGSILILMLSLIGIPPLAGFFGKLYVFMEALDQRNPAHSGTLIWLVALGLFNSVVSAFYYVRVLKAMYLREPGARRLSPASPSISLPILLGAGLMIVAGVVLPDWLLGSMQAAAVPMLNSSAPMTAPVANLERDAQGNIVKKALPPVQYSDEMQKGLARSAGMAPTAATKKAGGEATSKKSGAPAKAAASPTPTKEAGPTPESKAPARP